jgi:hypothetical protein
MEKETIEEAAEKYFDYNIFCDGITDFEKEISLRSYIAGAKLQQERMYTYDEMRGIAYQAYCLGQLDEPTEGKYNLWIQQFKSE